VEAPETGVLDLAGGNLHDSPLLAPILDLPEELGPLRDDITMYLGVGYDSDKTRTEPAARDPSAARPASALRPRRHDDRTVRR
jgi:hypothetical protein